MTLGFTLIPANDYIWNHTEFIKFLISRQGQPIVINTNNEGVSLQSAGVYKLLDQFGYTDVTIYTANWLEFHPTYKIKAQYPYMFFKLSANNYQHLHCWNQDKIFGCFYNRPLWHRIGLAAELQTHYSDISLINVRADPNDVDQRKLFEIKELFEEAPGSMFNLANVMCTWPRQVESIDTYTVGNTTIGHTDQIADFYPNFLIDIVGETWTRGRSFYPTEKTIRPMLLKKPFVIMGSRDYLAYLRQLGFWTFNHFWDEDYDGYANGERYNAILKLLEWISKKPKQELYDIYIEMQYVLDHNYDLLMSGKYARKVQYIND
jgi:hypothetical protein